MIAHGILTPLDGGKDNLALSQATHVLLCRINKQFVYLGAALFEFSTFNHDCRVARGLYHRAPDNYDQNSVDNYAAICFGDPEAAEGIYWRCLWRLGIFSNGGKFEPRAIFSRFLGFRPYAKFRAGKKLNWLDQGLVIWSMNLTLNDNPTDTSNKCLQVLINSSLKGQYPKIDQAIGKWTYAMSLHYRGLKSLYSYYWHESHPYCMNAPDNWDFLK